MTTSSSIDYGLLRSREVSQKTTMIRLILALLALSLLSIAPAYAYEAKYDKDVGSDCADRVDDCLEDEETFYDCSTTCRLHLQNIMGRENRTRFSGSPRDPDAFYDLQVETKGGSTMSLERFEGFMVVIAAIPLLSGLGNFYFDSLERLVATFPPHTIEVLALPILQLPPPIGKGDAKIRHNANSKITCLKGWIPSTSNSVLKYMGEAARMNDDDFHQNAVTIFIRSFDGNPIKAGVLPSISDIKEMIDPDGTMAKKRVGQEL